MMPRVARAPNACKTLDNTGSMIYIILFEGVFVSLRHHGPRRVQGSRSESPWMTPFPEIKALSDLRDGNSIICELTKATV